MVRHLSGNPTYQELAVPKLQRNLAEKGVSEIMKG
jgi:hypothetical protein